MFQIVDGLHMAMTAVPFGYLSCFIQTGLCVYREMGSVLSLFLSLAVGISRLEFSELDKI